MLALAYNANKLNSNSKMLCDERDVRMWNWTEMNFDSNGLVWKQDKRQEKRKEMEEMICGSLI